jgi:hypothetical protein
MLPMGSPRGESSSGTLQAPWSSIRRRGSAMCMMLPESLKISGDSSPLEGWSGP